MKQLIAFLAILASCMFMSCADGTVLEIEETVQEETLDKSGRVKDVDDSDDTEDDLGRVKDVDDSDDSEALGRVKDVDDSDDSGA